MLAVLQTAVADLLTLGNDGRAGDRAQRAELEQWFDSRESLSPFAFLTICDAVGFDSGALRARIRRQVERGVGRQNGTPRSRAPLPPTSTGLSAYLRRRYRA